MTSPYLPDDCIYDILKYLQNSRSILFNCLLVNRFWCKTTIPLLYANPFDNLSNKNNYSIILTLILCFNKTQILHLKNQLNLIDIYEIDINIEYKPLFEYLKYIENYNHSIMNSIIFQWFKGYLYLSYDQRNKICTNFIPIIHQLILLKCSKIKQLNISLYLFHKKNFDIHFIKTFTSNLSRLDSLNLRNLGAINNNEVGLEFLDNLGNICLNLRELNLVNTNPTITNTNLTNTTKEKLCTFIQKQNNLKIFKTSYLLDDILLSLEFQQHSLVFIEFENVNFSNISFKNLINFCNLKYLKFYDCRELSLDQCEILKFSSFKLKELKFYYNIWNYDISLLIIKYLGASLQSLFLSDKLIISIIENILVYCSNLIILGITIDSSVDLLVLPYFKNLKIRKLKIIFTEHIIDSEICANLAINLPTGIKEISISFGPYFNYYYFEKFLKNIHDYLEVINLGHFIDLKFLKVILNYTERNNNNLKILGFMGLGKEWDDDMTNLLVKFKDKGIKLIGLNNVDKL